MMPELAPWRGGRSGSHARRLWAGQPLGRVQPFLHSTLLRSSSPYSSALPQVPIPYQHFYSGSICKPTQMLSPLTSGASPARGIT
jgi:hypothetical protein